MPKIPAWSFETKFRNLVTPGIFFVVGISLGIVVCLIALLASDQWKLIESSINDNQGYLQIFGWTEDTIVKSTCCFCRDPVVLVPM